MEHMEPCPNCTLDDPRYCLHTRDRAYLEADAGETPRRQVTLRRQLRVDSCCWHEGNARARFARMQAAEAEQDAARPQWQPDPRTVEIVSNL